VVQSRQTAPANPHAVFNCCPWQTLPRVQHPVAQLLELQIPPSTVPPSALASPNAVPPSPPDELPPDDDPPPGVGPLPPVVSIGGRDGVDEHAPAIPAQKTRAPVTKAATFMP
jgi:hypothetical protein